jgi:hypothetical protein
MIATQSLAQPVKYSASTLTTASISTPPRLLSLSSRTFLRPHLEMSGYENHLFSTPKVLAALFRYDALFSKFVQELLRLTLPSQDNSEDLPATAYAVSTALYLSPFARFALGHRWTLPHVATDSYGGLRMSWIKGEREVRAVVPQDSAPGTRRRYLYWDSGEKYGSISNFTPSSLAAWLTWLG